MLRKTGELLFIRYGINLDGELLEIPDFYWDRPRLEPIYKNVCHLLDMRLRMQVGRPRAHRPAPVRAPRPLTALALRTRRRSTVS